jgi:HAD superfamily hydrolase (TIGR01509 family)
MKKGIIFDLDGVLINSEQLWKDTMTAFCAQFGVLYTPAMRSNTMGTNATVWSNVLRDACHLDHTEWPLERVREQVLLPMQHAYEKNIALLPGALELLNSIREKRIPCALASGSSSTNILFIFNRFNLFPYFQAIVSGDHVQNNKPAPDIFLKAASYIGIDPSDCVGIEDSPNGVRAVKAAGMKCIAIPDPWLGPEEVFAIADRRETTLNSITLADLLE